MIKRLLFILPLLIWLSACSLGGFVPEEAAAPEEGVPLPSPVTAETATAAPPATSTLPPAAAASASPTVEESDATSSAVTLPMPDEPAPVETPAKATLPTDLALAEADVFVYPIPQIYGGDAVTFRIAPHIPDNVATGDVQVKVEIGDRWTFQNSIQDWNLAGDPVSTFAWMWQTPGEPGTYPITVTVDPDDTIQAGDENQDNNQVVVSVPVLPPTARPVEEVGAEWIVAETACCTIHVVSGTAAHRDLEQIKGIANAAVQQATTRLGEVAQGKIDLYLIDRVIGQGGYASTSMVISYLDRNYAGGGFYEVLVHETVHLVDRQFAPYRIPFLGEGLAVWVTGGHYKQENIDQRVIALRETGLFVPLRDLINDFYPYQHEVGYLEAAGFVSYLVNTYGWQKTRSFYGSVVPENGQTYADTVDEQLQNHYGKTLDQIEADWMAYLETRPRDPNAVADLLATIRYYDVMRDYQLAYDPTAHFLQAWLPRPREMEERQITTDLLRHPSAELNVTLEVMLEAVDKAIVAGEYNRANVILDSVERALANDGVFLDPLGANYREIVGKLSALGLEVRDVDLDGNRAVVQATDGRQVRLTTVNLVLRNAAWVLVN